MQHKPITDPAELEALTADELFRRVQPLLRRGGLLSSYERLQRLKPNIYSVCFELAHAWQQSPHLDGAKVPFSDYLAAKLGVALQALDRKHYPNLYDSHGKYLPEGHTLSLDEEDIDGENPYVDLLVTTASYPSLTASAPWPQLLQNTADMSGIAQASSAALMQRIDDILHGRTNTPYRLARDEGQSTSEARCHPATGHFLAMTDFLAHHNATAVPTSIR